MGGGSSLGVGGLRVIKNKVSKNLGGGVTDFFVCGGGGGSPPKNGPAGHPARISHSAGSRYKCGVLHNIPYYTNNRFTAYFYEHIMVSLTYRSRAWSRRTAHFRKGLDVKYPLQY